MSTINIRTLYYKLRRRFSFLTILICSLLSINEAVSQNMSLSELTPNKYAYKNLELALKCDNCGIKQSAIYLIGKYKIAEGEYIIEDMLRTEKDPCTKILASLVLMELNEVKGFSALKKLSNDELNQETRKIALQTFYLHLINDTDRIKDKQKVD